MRLYCRDLLLRGFSLALRQGVRGTRESSVVFVDYSRSHTSPFGLGLGMMPTTLLKVADPPPSDW